MIPRDDRLIHHRMTPKRPPCPLANPQEDHTNRPHKMTPQNDPTKRPHEMTPKPPTPPPVSALGSNKCKKKNSLSHHFP